MKLWMMVTTKTGEPFTHGGRILTHEDRDELAYLFPKNRIVEYRGSEGEAMMLRDHPDMAAVTWPLDRKDFWRER